MSTPRPRVFLHIGARKSGTTSLRVALRQSEQALSAQGVHLVHPDRTVLGQRLVLPLREFVASGDVRVAEAATASLREEVKRHEAPVHLLSNERLAEMPRAVSDVMVAGLSDFEVHVVITLRHWGLTLPSEWQQNVKLRQKVAYGDFLASIRERAPVWHAEKFLARQDVADIIDRWGALLPSSRVHVIACPPRSRTTDSLGDLFCRVVGIDSSTLRRPKATHNVSLSLAQAELLRRVNIALGDRLLRGGGYEAVVRRWVLAGSMGRRDERSSILLPEEYRPWVVEETRSQLDAVLGRGVDLVGHPEDLLAAPDAPCGPSRVPETDLLDRAVETIADLAVRHQREVAKYERTIARLRSEREKLREAVRRSRSSTTSRRTRDH